MERLYDFVETKEIEPTRMAKRVIQVQDKIEELRKVFKKDIQVDGGLNDLTAAEVRLAGANVIVAGSAVFGAKDYALAIKKIKGEE